LPFADKAEPESSLRFLIQHRFLGGMRMLARLGYEESIRDLQRRGVLSGRGVVPPLPPRRPVREDPSGWGLEFERTSLEDCVIEGLSLPRTYFCRAGIYRVSFRNTDLSESTLCWCDFIDVDFTEASLRGSDLRCSIFERVRFAGADLREADLRRSSYLECDFTDAWLEGAILLMQQEPALSLTADQRRTIAWTTDRGVEPGGG
jgi:hypothetical protein